MSLLEWTEDMSVGVPELDADHKGLIAVVNRLEASVKDPERRDVVRQCLYALLRYAEIHFKREERVMAACDFPELGHHKDEHRDFVEKIRDLARRFDDEPDETVATISEQLLDFLKDWFHDHVLIEDMAYRPYAEGRAAAREAAKSFRAAEIWWES
jgi:hemerythrin-like metal-binding protein